MATEHDRVEDLRARVKAEGLSSPIVLPAAGGREADADDPEGSGDCDECYGSGWVRDPAAAGGVSDCPECGGSGAREPEPKGGP